MLGLRSKPHRERVFTLLTDLLAKVALVTNFLHLVDLGFEKVDMFFFILKEALE